jgi:hypothetical protein
LAEGAAQDCAVTEGKIKHVTDRNLEQTFNV